MYSPLCDSTSRITCNTADFLSGVCKPMGSEAEERSTTITTAPSISCETKETYAGKLLLYCSLNFTILGSEYCGSNWCTRCVKPGSSTTENGWDSSAIISVIANESVAHEDHLYPISALTHSPRVTIAAVGLPFPCLCPALLSPMPFQTRHTVHYVLFSDDELGL